MRLDDAQRKAWADWLLKFALFWLTSVPVSVIIGKDDVPVMLIIAVGTVGIISLILGISFSKDKKQKSDNTIHTDIKKGVIHIHKAEIQANK